MILSTASATQRRAAARWGEPHRSPRRASSSTVSCGRHGVPALPPRGIGSGGGSGRLERSWGRWRASVGRPRSSDGTGWPGAAAGPGDGRHPPTRASRPLTCPSSPAWPCPCWPAPARCWAVVLRPPASTSAPSGRSSSSRAWPPRPVQAAIATHNARLFEQAQARLPRGAGGEPPQGRVPRHAVARAAQRDRRLGAPAGLGQPRRGRPRAPSTSSPATPRRRAGSSLTCWTSSASWRAACGWRSRPSRCAASRPRPSSPPSDSGPSAPGIPPGSIA